MAMIELVFTACLIASPEKCEDKHLTFAGNISPMACMMGAQPELAKWNEGHPKWRVGKWKCRSVRSLARDA